MLKFTGVTTGVTARKDCQHSRGYATIGTKAVDEINTKRFSLNMFLTIINQGFLQFMMYEMNMIARVLIKFMKRLIKDANRNVFSYWITCECIMRCW